MRNIKVSSMHVAGKLIIVLWLQVYLFVFLMVILESVSQKEQCDAESQVKMSILSGLRHNFTTGNSVMMNLQASIDIKKAKWKSWRPIWHL